MGIITRCPSNMPFVKRGMLVGLMLSVKVVPEGYSMPFPYCSWGEEDELNRVMWYLDDEIRLSQQVDVHYLVYITLEAEFPELTYL